MPPLCGSRAEQVGDLHRREGTRPTRTNVPKMFGTMDQERGGLDFVLHEAAAVAVSRCAERGARMLASIGGRKALK